MNIIKNGEKFSYNDNDNAITVFLGGSFTSAWRAEVIEELSHLTTPDEKLVIFDPSFEGDDIKARTRWEHSAINRCDVFACYLNEGGVHPISLFELGYSGCLMDNIVVGMTKDYKKANEIATEMEVVSSGLSGSHNYVLKDTDPKEFATAIHNMVALIELENGEE